jgi:tetratricopeptide (TPR) repeat protein
MYFKGRKSDFAEALKYCQKAYSLAESIGYPTIVGYYALKAICYILIVNGKPLSALPYAKEVYRYVEHIGDIYGQAWSLYLQARCHIQLANYWQAQGLLQKSRDMLAACGLQQSAVDLGIVNHQAEIHFVKSEYLESRKLHVTIASSCQPSSYSAILANLNTALIDTVTGADSKLIHQNLHACQFRLTALYGFQSRHMCLIADFIAAGLCLRDGALETANAMFEKCVASSLDISTELALLCLERLGDLSTGMNGISTTLRWGGVFLSLTLRCKDKYRTMQAFRCLGQILSAEGDNETALSVFNVALDGFTFMDIHHWRADCMVRIAEILNHHREVMKAVELWKAARPLFERSSQMKEMIKIDKRLAEVDSVVLVEYEEQLQRLSEVHVSVKALEETCIEDDEEEKLAEGSDFGDNGRQGVSV